MESSEQEGQVILAVQAIHNKLALSARAVAKFYLVSQANLCRRLKGTISQRDIMPKSRNLTDLEQSTIVQHILDLHARAFLPRLCDMEDMANRLLVERTLIRRQALGFELY